MSDILRIYDPAECDAAGVPLDFQKCRTCDGTGRYRDVRIWGTMPGSVICEVCGGYGSLKAAALAERMNPKLWANIPHTKVQIRCESCQHPMSEGTWEHTNDLADVLGYMQVYEQVMRKIGRGVVGELDQETPWTHYSRCDENCEHGGPGRMKFWTPAYIQQQDVTQARTAAFSPASTRSSPQIVEASWRPVDVRCMSWAHDLRPESLKVLCLRCYADAS